MECQSGVLAREHDSSTLDDVMFNTTWLKSDRVHEFVTIFNFEIGGIVKNLWDRYRDRKKNALACIALVGQSDLFWEKEAERLQRDHRCLSSSFASSFLLYIHSAYGDALDRQHRVVEVTVPSLCMFVKRLYKQAFKTQDVLSGNAAQYNIRDQLLSNILNIRLVMAELPHEDHVLIERDTVSEQSVSNASTATETSTIKSQVSQHQLNEMVKQAMNGDDARDPSAENCITDEETALPQTFDVDTSHSPKSLPPPNQESETLSQEDKPMPTPTADHVDSEQSVNKPTKENTPPQQSDAPPQTPKSPVWNESEIGPMDSVSQVNLQHRLTSQMLPHGDETSSPTNRVLGWAPQTSHSHNGPQLH